MLQHDGMSGNVPPGIKSHAALAVGQYLDAFCIERVEPRVGQDTPVGGLQIMQTLDLLLAGEGAG